MITYGSTTLTSYNTITKIEVYYYKSTSATDLAGGSWSTTKPTWENGKYIWQKIKTTYEGKLENGQFYSESDPVNITGQQGATGTAAYSYKLNASDSVIGKTKTGEYTIDKITFTATYKQGSGAVTAYTGRFKIETTANGTTWTTQYTSSGNESSKEYTIPEDIISIRCSLYQSGGTSTLLDIVTIPVVKDGIDAVGLRDSIPYYLASDKQTGVTRLDQGWTRFKPELTTEKRYLWVYYVSRYSEGNTQPELIEIKNDIVSFENHGDESPVENCVIDIEPVQDLNGQSSPYPAGGGKNLLYVPTGRTYTGNGVTWTLNQNGSITVSGTATEASTFYYVQQEVGEAFNGDYYFQCFPTISSNIFQGGVKVGGTWFSVYASAKTALTGISGKIQQMWFQVRAGQTLNTTLYPMIYKASETVTEWSPYSNICPISGWTGANVVRTGVNVWDEEWELGWFDWTTGQEVVSYAYIRFKNLVSVKPATQYVFVKPSGIFARPVYYDADGVFVSCPDVIYTANTYTVFTIPDNVYYVRFAIKETSYSNDVSLNYPSTDHDYHPYAGDTYSITFPTEAGTVYGGELDVTNGVLTVDRAHYVVTNVTEITNDNAYTDFNRVNIVDSTGKLSGKPNGAIISNVFKPGTLVVNGVFMHGTTGVINFTPSISIGTTLPEIKAWLIANNAEFCYELATPITYTLTPQEIAMLTGQNHIFSDTGQTAISYYDNQTSTDPYVDYSATSAFEVADKAWAATQPLAIKTYNDVTITANNDPKGWLYFGTVKPTNYNTPWKIRYKVYASINGITDSYQQSEIMIEGAKDTYYTYRTYNMISNTNYRPLYAYSLYTLKQAGVNNGYGHLIGIRFQSAYWPNSTYTNYKRTIKIEIIESTNCQITLADTMFLYTDASGTGSTNYNTRYSFDGTTQGYTGSGDRNETNHILNNFSGKTGVLGIWSAGLFMRDGNGTYQNICTDSAGGISRTVDTTKKPNPNGFEIGSQIYYSPWNTYNANSDITGSVYASYGAFDSRYSLNTTLTANCLTPYQPIYLVGTIRTNGLFYLDTVWWTQTPTDSSKTYVLIGGCYDSTTSYCRINLYEQNNWYKYVNGKLVDYTNRLAELAATTATAYITDTTNNGIMVHPENDTTSGWSIAGAIELFKTGISYIKLWIDNNIPKIRIGKEDSKHVLIDDDSVDIVDDENVLASFGETARIGNNNASHSYFDYHSFQMIDKGGNTYFHVSDLRNAQGKATLTETFWGDGTTTRFSISLAATSVVSVKINDIDTSAYTKSGVVFIFTTAPADGDEITIVYETIEMQAKAYTFGLRGTENIGALSVAEGDNTNASGFGSHAEGKETSARGRYSHVEGVKTIANGFGSHVEGERTIANESFSHAEGFKTTANESYSHAEGFGTTASGLCSHSEGEDTIAAARASHAQNLGTIASKFGQTALGAWNEEDLYNSIDGKYIVIIGNGSDENHRSNALAITWDGDAEFALDTTASSSTLDADLYDAITALGWENDVIV